MLDPSLAEAHAALGVEKSHYEFDFPGAEKEFLKAIEVNPNSPYAHLFYSNCFLMPMGRKAQAIAENKRALELDPLSLPINNFMGMTYMFAGGLRKCVPAIPAHHRHGSQFSTCARILFLVSDDDGKIRGGDQGTGKDRGAWRLQSRGSGDRGPRSGESLQERRRKGILAEAS